MNIDPNHARIADARAAEAALVVAARNPEILEAVESAANAALESAYATTPTTASGIAALARLVLDCEGELEPAVRKALESIERGAMAIARHCGNTG